jgi:hypothetical protein
MSVSDTAVSEGLGRRLMLTACVLFVLLLSGLTVSGAVDRAHATPPGGSTNFCTNVWLQPFGQNGDRCSAGKDNWGRIMSVNIMTYQRAGCVNYHGWYGEYYRSWECFGSYGGGVIYLDPNDQGSYIGIIRNNNMSYGGKYNAGFYCCKP